MRESVWLYPGASPWHFITLDKRISQEIKESYGKRVRGFGSIRVRATIGKTSWQTSIFPDRKAGAYLLPLKASVRKKEKIAAGAMPPLLIHILI